MGAEHSTASASSSSTERTVGRAAMAAAASSSRARVVRRGDAGVDDAHVVDSTDDASLVEALERVRSARARAGALDDGFLRPAPSARGGGAETANDEALARALQAEEDAAAERADNGSAVGTASGGGERRERVRRVRMRLQWVGVGAGRDRGRARTAVAREVLAMRRLRRSAVRDVRW